MGRMLYTVVVETLEGIKSGSAVREINAYWLPEEEYLPAKVTAAAIAKAKKQLDEIKPSILGEAVVVDLGERGVLFALLKGHFLGVDHGESIIYYVFPSGEGYTTAEGIKYYRDLKDKKAVLEPTHYPTLVTFTDLNDPRTVKPVLEMETDGKYPVKYTIRTDHFEELFGEGVKLKEITIEMTDEPVTHKVDKYLPEYDGKLYSVMPSDFK